MTSDYAIARAAWLELEQLHTHTPPQDARCRKCGALVIGAPLCESCESSRVDGLKRFGGRPVGRQSPRRVFSATRPEYLPYKDAEDHR